MSAEQFRKLRKDLGLTQKQMGAEVGITADAIQKLESGRNRVTQTMQILIALKWDRQAR